MLNLVVDSLRHISIKAALLWEKLEGAETPEEEGTILSEIWENQEDGETAADIQAEIADQLDAEITALKARKDYFMQQHNVAIVRLERWRSALDNNILQLHQLGAIATSLVGKRRQIVIKQNPPSCEVLIDPKELPKEYRTRKVVYTPDKTKIKAAWKQGIPVEGTHIVRKERVEYKLVASNLSEASENVKERSNQNDVDNNGSKTEKRKTKTRTVA
ncbi:MAG: siphovirus Gp157 family protein [Crinalium sp.]